MATSPRTGQIRSASQTVSQENFEVWVSDATFKLLDFETRISNIELADVSALASDVATLQSQLSTLESDVQSNDVDISALDNLITSIDARLTAIETPLSFTIQYDAQDRIEALNYTDGATTQIIYDSDGNITQVITPSVTKTLNYDGAGTLIGISIS